MRGAVTADREAIVRLTLEDATGQHHAIDVVIDTGYTGWLTLPPNFIMNLGLPFNRFGRAALANGSEIAFSIYWATLWWDRQPLQIKVDEVNAEPLLGMALMDGYKLTIEDIDGGRVTIERLGLP